MKNNETYIVDCVFKFIWNAPLDRICDDIAGYPELAEHLKHKIIASGRKPGEIWSYLDGDCQKNLVNAAIKYYD